MLQEMVDLRSNSHDSIPFRIEVEDGQKRAEKEKKRAVASKTKKRDRALILFVLGITNSSASIAMIGIKTSIFKIKNR
jgi:hypothetical protein